MGLMNGYLVGGPDFFQRVSRMMHFSPVRLASHYDTNKGVFSFFYSLIVVPSSVAVNVRKHRLQPVGPLSASCRGSGSFLNIMIHPVAWSILM
jgi:hypothetical protein